MTLSKVNDPSYYIEELSTGKFRVKVYAKDTSGTTLEQYLVDEMEGHQRDPYRLQFLSTKNAATNFDSIDACKSSIKAFHVKHTLPTVVTTLQYKP